MGVYDERTGIESSRPLWLALISAILGLLLGLVIGWVVWPVEWDNIRPSHLEPDSKAQFISAIADTYVANGETEDALNLARRRLIGIDKEDLGIAFKYFNNELLDDVYGQAAQFDTSIRYDNLTRLSYALNIEPAQAMAAVDTNSIALRDPNTIIGAQGSGQEDGILATESQLDPVAESSGSRFNFGQILQNGFTCLTALALILGGLYLLRYWWYKRARGLDEPELSEHVGPYQDKPRGAVSLDSGSRYSRRVDYDDDDFEDDDGDFEGDEDFDFAGPVTHEQYSGYEEEDEWQGGMEEFNPSPYRPSEQFVPEPDDPSLKAARSQLKPPQPPPTQPDSASAGEIESYDARGYGPSAKGAILSASSAVAGSAVAGNSVSGSAGAASIAVSPQPSVSTPPEQTVQSIRPRSPENLPPAPIDTAYTPTPEPSPRSATRPSSTQAKRRRPTEAATSGNYSGNVLAQFTTQYKRGTPQYEQQRIIVASSDTPGHVEGAHIGEYGMGTNIKSGVLQNDAENVIALDVWLFDKTDQQGPRNQTRVLISKYVDEHNLTETIMRDDASNAEPLIPIQGDEFEIRGTSLLLICKVIEAVYVKSGDMKGIFESITVDMTVFQN